MKITTAQQTIDVNVVRSFMNKWVTQMPELKTVMSNGVALNGIVALFQAFANNTERINQFFAAFKRFLSQYDQTKETEEAERSGRIKSTTTMTSTPAPVAPVK